MRTSTVTELPWPAAPASQPDPEPDDLAACLAGPNGLDLVVEMAHDLRSPLTSIVLLAEALQSGQSGAVSAAQQRELGLIYSAALSLCGTASDVIELARGSTRLVDRQAVASADDVAVMYGGRIVELAPTKTLYDRPEMPYTLGLLSSIPRMDREPTDRLAPIRGNPPSPIKLPKGCVFQPRCNYFERVPGGRCFTERPDLLESEPDHFVRCHIPHEEREQIAQDVLRTLTAGPVSPPLRMSWGVSRFNPPLAFVVL